VPLVSPTIFLVKVLLISIHNYASGSRFVNSQHFPTNNFPTNITSDRRFQIEVSKDTKRS